MIIMYFRKKLPSLTALVALEATIRHRSFTLAAKELGVTQAAVSRMIALLEEDFGRPLFSRGHRTIEPTPSCLIFGATLADCFSELADGVEALRGDTGDVVTIGATIAFSSLWLLPKLSQFRRENPGIQIRVISQDGRFSMDSGEVDIAFHYGTSSPYGTTAIASAGDRIFPVCSPEYRAGHDLEDFPRGSYELIETDFSSRSWVRWADWFNLTGRKPGSFEPALRFTHYTETILAAKDGQGIALGWDTLVRPFIEDGSLVKASAIEFDAEGRHMILVPAHSRRSAVTDLVSGWLTQALQQAR